MKICEFEKIAAMLNARSVFLEILLSTEGLTPPEAMEHWRMTITESIRLVELDLLAAGIEIDDPTTAGT